jgi:TRAP-type C4-dicarboxylate transport system permease small subunit
MPPNPHSRFGTHEGGGYVRALLTLTTRWCGYGSALFLTAMMLVTVIDVVLRAIFNLPVTGTYDLVQLFLVGTVFLSIPDVFLHDKNIVIDFVDHVFGGRVVGMLKVIANILSLGFLAVLCWRMFPPALDSAHYHEVSPDLSIPMTVHWVLMILGILVTLPAAGWVLIESVKDLSREQDRQ